MSTIPTATGAAGRASISPRQPALNSKVPPARFVQWKSVLHAGNPAPRVDDVLLNYLPKNVAPEIDEITVQPGYHYQPIPHVTGTEPPAPGSRVSILRRPPCATRFDRAFAGWRMMTTTTNSSTAVLSRRWRIALAVAEEQSLRPLLFFRRQSSAGWRLHREGHRLRCAFTFARRSPLRRARQLAL